MDIVFDIECYSNYFLIMFMNIENQKIKYFEKFNDVWAAPGLHEFIIKRRRTFIGFNSDKYDLPVLAEALKHDSTNKSIKAISDALIVDRVKPWELGLNIPKLDHIDIIDPSPAVATGLKIYGGRMHSKKLQDLPLEPSSIIEDPEPLRTYCINDLHLTAELYQQLKPVIELRENLGGKYFRSKSDAQMGEALFKQKLNSLGIDTEKVKAAKTFQYAPPKWIEFEDPDLVAFLTLLKSTTFKINQSDGKPISPEGVKNKVLLDRFEFGIGGIHSKEKAQTIRCEEGEMLFEIDFASFYPHIILREGFYPKHLSPKFLEMYGQLMAERLEAKRSGNEIVNQGYKIAINGSFGKLGNKYSFLYSPDLMPHITITGQLIILMLIESVENTGARVVSANTDGIVIKCREDEYHSVHEAYLGIELLSGIELEETRYKALYSQSVNCYLAVKPDGSTKGKGLYSPPSLKKSPRYEICSIAVRDFLTKGTPIHETVHGHRDIRNFVYLTKVTGGALYEGKDIGKVIRFYHATAYHPDGLTCIKTQCKSCLKPLREAFKSNSKEMKAHFKKHGYFPIWLLDSSKKLRERMKALPKHNRALHAFCPDCHGDIGFGKNVSTSEGAVPIMELPDKCPGDVNYSWYVENAVEMLKRMGV